MPQFSTQSLLVFVALTAAYFGAWEATKRAAERTESEARSAKRVVDFKFSAPVPFFICSTDPYGGGSFNPCKTKMNLWFPWQRTLNLWRVMDTHGWTFPEIPDQIGID